MSTPQIIELTFIFLAVLVATIVCGLILLPQLRRLNVGQQERDDGPKSHLQKSGTPTFGGLIFMIPLFLFAIWALFTNGRMAGMGMLVLLMLLFMMIGFADDYIKIRISRKGLSERQKMMSTTAVSVLFAVYYVYLSPWPVQLILPLGGGLVTIVGWWKLLYLAFIVAVLFFTTNSVNLTDGVDGLASSVTAIVMACMVAAGALLWPEQSPLTGAISLAAAIAAGCLGFLAFNRYPAKVFMGDTGSLALGAGLSGIAVFLGVPWLILFAGIIYAVESLSVFLQRIYYRRTGGRRIFRMSPIHHHFELGGWSEKKVVRVFCLATLGGSLTGLLLLL